MAYSNPVPPYIGQRIKYIRQKVLRLNQEDMAEILNTKQANISYLENESRQSELTISLYIYFIKSGINLEWIFLKDNSNVSILKQDII